VLVTQPGVADPGRAPGAAQTLWAYCHVPAGSDVDMTARVEAQIERFAPGFGDMILARHTMTTVARPVPRWNPYRTPLPGVYLCSSSTPPLPGVHGRCGELAALSALRDVFGIRQPPDLGLTLPAPPASAEPAWSPS
jgi:phytoene dehydrogenase-like protein